MTSLDNELIEVKINAEVEDIVVTLAANVGPPGPPGPDTEAAISEHVSSGLPHPVYDDGPSFVILYENAKV